MTNSANTAKLFMSGRSQAIRLPAKFRLEAQEVRIEKIGDALWVQPEMPLEQNMSVWLSDFYATHLALPPEFLSDRQDAPPEERDWA